MFIPVELYSTKIKASVNNRRMLSDNKNRNNIKNTKIENGRSHEGQDVRGKMTKWVL